MTGNFIRAWVYVFPWLCLPCVFLAWAELSASWTFACFVLGVPIIYGYVAPGVATNILKKWRFRGAWVVGAYYWHHGFMYAANMSPLLLLAFLGTPEGPLSMATCVRVALVTAALHGFVLWWHDILLVRHNRVEIHNRPAREGRSPEEIVTHYAPLCFSLIGLAYAAGALLAYEQIVVRSSDSLASLAACAGIAVAVLIALPSLAYRWFCE